MKTQIKKPKASIIIVNFNNAKYLFKGYSGVGMNYFIGIKK